MASGKKCKKADLKRKVNIFEVKITPKKLRSEANDVPAKLVLAPFQPHPKLAFENVKIGSTGKLKLQICNPSPNEMQIEFLNESCKQDGFEFTFDKLSIPANDSMLLGINWTPTSSNSTCRHVIGIRPIGKVRCISEFIITASAFKPQGLKDRMLQRDKLSKVEQKMKRTSKPLTEKNSVVDETPAKFYYRSEEINIRRSTFTVTKAKEQSEERGENKSQRSFFNDYPRPWAAKEDSLTARTPAASSRLDSPPSTPTLFDDKTFDLSNFTLSEKPSSKSERFSVDSLESEALANLTCNIISPVTSDRRITKNLKHCNIDLLAESEKRDDHLSRRESYTNGSNINNQTPRSGVSESSHWKQSFTRRTTRSCDSSLNLDELDFSVLNYRQNKNGPNPNDEPWFISKHYDDLDSSSLSESSDSKALPSKRRISRSVEFCNDGYDSPSPTKRGKTIKGNRSAVGLMKGSCSTLSRTESDSLENSFERKLNEFDFSTISVSSNVKPNKTDRPLDLNDDVEDSLFIETSEATRRLRSFKSCDEFDRLKSKLQCGQLLDDASSRRIEDDKFCSSIEPERDLVSIICRDEVQIQKTDEKITAMCSNSFGEEAPVDLVKGKNNSKKCSELPTSFVLSPPKRLRQCTVNQRLAIANQPSRKQTKKCKKSLPALMSEGVSSASEGARSTLIKKQDVENLSLRKWESTSVPNHAQLDSYTVEDEQQVKKKNDLEERSELPTSFALSPPKRLRQRTVNQRLAVANLPSRKSKTVSVQVQVDLDTEEDQPAFLMSESISTAKEGAQPTIIQNLEAEKMSRRRECTSDPDQEKLVSNTAEDDQCHQIRVPPALVVSGQSASSSSESFLVLSEGVSTAEDGAESTVIQGLESEKLSPGKQKSASVQEQVNLNSVEFKQVPPALVESVSIAKEGDQSTRIQRLGVEKLSKSYESASVVDPEQLVSNTAEDEQCPQTTRIPPALVVSGEVALPPPSTSSVNGLWTISPPKRVTVKPPSDSPVVLPPPSRVHGRSNVPLRPFQSGKTVKRSFTQRRCDSDSLTIEGDKPPADHPTISGCASVGRPFPSRSTTKTNIQPGSVRRLPPKRLKLGSTTSLNSESSVSSSSALLCKPLEAPEPSCWQYIIDLDRNPFHEDLIAFLPNSVLDENEKELLKWVNKILSPPLELEATCMMPSKSELQCVRQPAHNNAHAPPAPVYRLFSVRRAATALLLSADVARVLSKVNVAIDKDRVAVRADKDLHRDLGLQGIVLRLLMSYHPLWLRVALETVYGRAIHLHSNSDVVGLVNFIRRNLLSDNYLKATYSHPTVPHLMLPKFEEKMKKFILNKFVMIVYFLDQAKTHKLIRHDPCLFCKDSPFKDSRSILLEFNKELMKGGDMTKYLATMGYKLVYKQTYLEEFDFKLKDRSCLRDGVRLVKLVDVMLNERICSKLRVPAISRTQKVHNVSVALRTFEARGNEIENQVTAKDVVDGHREKTLSLLWQLRGNRRQDAARVIALYWIEKKPMIKERMRFIRQRMACVRIQRWLRARRAAQNEDRARLLRMRAAANTIKRRWRANKIAQRDRAVFLKMKQAVIEISNAWFATLQMRKERNSFIRLKWATILVQKKWRERKLTNANNEINTATSELSRERCYFLKLRETTIFVQRHWRKIQTVREDKRRFLAIRKASICIQQKWRATLLMRVQKTSYARLKKAVAFIEEKRLSLLTARPIRALFLGYRRDIIQLKNRLRIPILLRQNKFDIDLITQQRSLLSDESVIREERPGITQLRKAVDIIENGRWNLIKLKEDRSQYLKIRNATIIIQRRLKATLLMRKHKREYTELREAVNFISNKRWSLLQMRKDRSQFLEMKSSAILIQRKLRATILMKQEKLQYLNLIKAVKFVGNKRWALINMRYHRNRFLKMRTAAVLIQHRFRETILMKQHKQKYLDLKKAVEFISNKRLALLKMREDRNRFLKMRSAALLIQHRFRATILMKQHKRKYEDLKKAVEFISNERWSIIQMRKDRIQFLKWRCASIVIQKRLKATLLMRQQKIQYLNLKKAVKFISDRRWSIIQMRKDRSQFLKRKCAIIVIQRRLKATLLMKQHKHRYLDLKKAVNFISNKRWSLLQMRIDRCRFLEMKSAVELISNKRLALLKMRENRNRFFKMRSAVIVIQRRLKATLLMRKQKSQYLNLLKAVKFISNRRWSIIQMRKDRSQFLKRKCATIVIQKRLKATLLMRKQKSQYLNLLKAVKFISNRRWSIIQMRKDRSQFLKRKCATIVIQKRLKATLLMKQHKQKYLDLKKSVEFISNKRLALLKMREDRNRFLKMWSSAVIIQRRLKATLLMRKHKREYTELREAVNFISNKRWSLLQMRKDRSQFLEMKSSAILIQRKLRATILMKQEKLQYSNLIKAVKFVGNKRWALINMRYHRNRFLKMRTAAVLIQHRFRETILMKQHKQKYLDLKKAVEFISNKRLALLKMREDRNRFLKMKSSAIIIQRKIKATLLMRQHKSQYLKLLKAVKLISNKRWSLIQMRNDRSQFLKRRCAAVVIQERFRATLLMRKEESNFHVFRSALLKLKQRREASILKAAFNTWKNRVQKSRIQQEENKRRERAAVKIQAFWRGYCYRKRLILANRRCFRVYSRRDTSQKTLREAKERIVQSLYRNRSLHALLKLLNLVNVMTTVSVELAVELVEEKLVYVLCDLLTHTLTRSGADQEARLIIVHILINLTKLPQTQESVWKTLTHNKGPEEIYDMALNFCKSNVKLFCACTTLLWLWSHDAVKVSAFWRGYCYRKRLILANRRCFRVYSRRDTSQKTLREAKERIVQSLYRNRSLHALLKLLNLVNVMTTVSVELAVELVEEKLVYVLCDLLTHTLTRSGADQEARLIIVHILINLTKLPQTQESVWKTLTHNKGPEEIYDMALNFCKSNVKLFCACTTLLWLWSHDSVKVSDMMAMPKVTYCIKRMAVEIQKLKTPSDSKRFFMPSRVPDWGFKNKRAPKLFEDPVHAWNSLIFRTNKS